MTVRGHKMFQRRSAFMTRCALPSLRSAVRGLTLSLLAILHLTIAAPKGLGEEESPSRGTIEYSFWTEDDSDSEFRPSILPTVFTNPLDPAQPNAIEPELPPMPRDGLSTEVDSLRRLTADLTKRLTELEKSGKSKDEAEAKKANTFPTFKMTGFLQLDSAYYSQTPLNIATVGNAQDGTGFRRARLAVQGKVAEMTNYQLEMDFATAGRPSFFDNYLEQENIPILGDVRVGQFLQPFSVDAMSGFRNLPFLERSLPFLAFVPFRRVGAMASNASEDDMTHWAYSVFHTGGFNNAPLGDDRYATDFGDVGGYSFSTRITHLLYYDEHAQDRYLWHVGMSYDYSQLGANTAQGSGTAGNAGSPKPFYQARTTPEFGPRGYPDLTSTFGSAVNSTPLFVDTGKYQASNFNLIGLETVYQWGATSIQAEYMATVVESVVGPIFYQGAYGEFMYRLTGENRVYDRKLAALKNPIPFTDFITIKGDGIRGWGAWSVSGRLSFVDLRNPSKLDGHYYDSAKNTFTGTSKAGNGLLTDTTVGLTWQLNAHTKIQFNWIHAMLNNTAKGYSTAELFASRFQVDF
jgi:phosphate-selective porin OprO/OprP